MPKVAAYALVWLEELGCYVTYEPGSADFKRLPRDDEEWFTWLAGCASFAFEGKQGHLTLRKEARARQGEYWYAYRCQNRRTLKRYAGRASELAIKRLEEIAGEISRAFALPGTPQAGHVAQAGPDPLAANLPLLTAKFNLPRLHRSLIARERLLALLDAGLEQPLTLLCAPAGSGKTTLVRQWLASRSDFPAVAWVSLDAGDNDPVRFWYSLFTAMQGWSTLSEQELFSLLYPPLQPYVKPLPLEAVLTTFLNEVARPQVHSLLILDDYHMIVENRIHETLGFFLAHLPETLHLVLLARHEPPLPLARLRANGHLNELRASDLRFTLVESAAFLQEFALTPQMLERLDIHLEGWAVGLRLLALALQGQTTQTRLEHTLATFNGRHRPILDYFITEVLHTQPAPIQDFLLRTSVLPRLTPALCATVTGCQESARLLEQIERGNLFLEALDEEGEWYRYHPLFADAMQHEARRRLGEGEPGAISDMASFWFEEHGMFSEAIDAALKAGKSTRAASLIEQLFQSPQIQETREFHNLRRWLEKLPTPLLQQSPMLCFGYAVALLFTLSPRDSKQAPADQIESLLQRAEESWQDSQHASKLGAIYAFRSTAAMRQGKMGAAANWGRRALPLLSEADIVWRSSSLNAVAFLALQKGDLHEARQFFQQVDDLAQNKGNAPLRGMAAIFLGLICFIQGELHQAARYYRKLTNNQNNAEIHPTSLLATLPLTFIFYEWNELEKLQEQAQKVFHLSKQLLFMPQNFLHVSVEIPLAILQHAQGETPLAIERLAKIWENRQLDENNFPFFLYQEALHWLVRLSFLCGDLPGAQRWLSELVRYYQLYNPPIQDEPQLPAVISSSPATEIAQAAPEPDSHGEYTLPPHLHEQKALLEARLDLLQGRAEVALDTLGTLLATNLASGRKNNLLQIKLLMAQAYAASKQPAQAHQWLLAALEQGYPEGYQRSFLDEGEQLAPLLRELLPHLQAEPLRGYVRTLLRGFTHLQQGQATPALPENVTLVDPLSPQELRVLRLLVTGCSNAEIARELVVSVNTVRTQIQSIYRKLQVNNRHAASQVAHRLHLG